MTVETPIHDEAVETLTPQAEGFGALMKNRNFMRLWIGQVFSQLGDRVVFVVFIAMIVHYFGSNDTYNSFLYIAFTIPAIFLTAVAGVFIDRWPRRAVLVITNVLRAAFVAFLPMAAESFLGLWGIYFTAFMLSASTQFFVPAEAATIPMIVKKSQLIPANSLFTTTMMASVIFGFALGDPLINIFSIHSVHWAIVGLFIIAALFLQTVNTPPPAVYSTESNGSNGKPDKENFSSAFRGFFAELKEGLDYIWQEKLILQAMLKLALLFSAVVAMCILFISFAKEFLYADPAVAARKFAYIITYSGIGMALGAVFVGKYFKHTKASWMVFSGFTVAGLCLTLISFIGSVPEGWTVFTVPEVSFGGIYFDPVHMSARMVYTYVLATLMGIGASFVAIPLQALLHEIIPADKRGKILGVQFTILSTSSTLPVLLAGFGVEWFGTCPMILLLGVPMFYVGVRGIFLRLNRAVASDW